MKLIYINKEIIIKKILSHMVLLSQSCLIWNSSRASIRKGISVAINIIERLGVKQPNTIRNEAFVSLKKVRILLCRQG